MLKSKKGLFASFLMLFAACLTASMLLNVMRASGDDDFSSSIGNFKFGLKYRSCYAILVVTVEDYETRAPLENSVVTVTVLDGAFLKRSLRETWQTGSLSEKTVLFPPKPYWWPRNREWPNAALAIFFIKFKPDIIKEGAITVKIEISKPGYISKKYDALIKNRSRFSICPRYCLNIEHQRLQKMYSSVPEFPVETSFVLFSVTASYLVIKKKLQRK